MFIRYNSNMDLTRATIKTFFGDNQFKNGTLPPSSFLEKFQQVAVLHANNVGVGFEDMLKQNLLWVTLRIKYAIVNHPLPGEPVTITTFASRRTVLEFDRDFIIESSRGVLVKATSKWCLIDKNTRRIAKMNILSPLDNLIQHPLFDEKFLKTETFETKNIAPVLNYVVKKSDLDGNGHMNNVVYAKIIEKSFIPNSNYNFFQINFLKEALLKDNLLIYKKNELENVFVGKLENGEISFTAEIY